MVLTGFLILSRIIHGYLVQNMEFIMLAIKFTDKYEKNMSIMIFILINISTVLAQKITCVSELKQFYISYFTYCISDNNKLDSLINTCCTQDFAKAWRQDVNETGLYDPLTNGFCDDYVMMRNTLSIRKSEGNSYIVTFDYLTWPNNDKKSESVIVYVNENGKIRHTKRPSDGYLTPDI